MDFIGISQKIKSQVEQSTNILVTAHQQPDADALGSMVAIGNWLNELGISHTKFCVDQPADNLRWMVDFEPIVTDPSFVLEQQYDIVFVLDSGDLEYAGVHKIIPQLLGNPQVINIDHHTTNQNFGDINLVDDTAVSTTVILYQFFRTLNIKISAKTASSMLAGIIFDTYNFTNPNTNQGALKTASSLLTAGASLSQVSDSILKTKTVDALKVWGKILMRLNYNPNFGIATTVVTAEDLQNGITKTEVSEGVANFLNNLSGVKAALILTEQGDGIIKGSFRTNDENINVAELAKKFGGGGHKKAAGFRIKGTLIQDSSGNWQIT